MLRCKCVVTLKYLVVRSALHSTAQVYLTMSWNYGEPGANHPTRGVHAHRASRVITVSSSRYRIPGVYAHRASGVTTVISPG